MELKDILLLSMAFLSLILIKGLDIAIQAEPGGNYPLGGKNV